MQQIKWLWSMMDKKFHKKHILALMISVVSSAALLVKPSLTGRLIDEVIVAQNTEPLVPLLVILLVAWLAIETSRYTMVILLETTSQNALHNMRVRLFRRMQHQDMHFYNENRTGDLMTRMSADMDWCRHFLAGIDYITIDSIAMFVSASIYLFFVHWKLALLLMVVPAVLMVVTKTYSKRVRPLFIDMRDRLSEMNTAAQENIAGNHVVKAFAREEYEKENFDKRSDAFRDSHLKINALWLKFYPFIDFLANAMTLITVFLGAFFIMKGEMSPGDLAVFTGTTWMLSNPMRNLGNMLNEYQRFVTSCEKVMQLDLRQPSVKDADDAVSHDRIKGKIEFRNVSFSYDSAETLKDIDFTVEPGQTLGIMGPTGSGKTTIIQLLARFYDVKSGEVLVDGCDVRKWKLQELRSGIGTALQEVFLFSDTVEGNVAFGDQEMTLDEVRDYAKRADADGFVMRLPEKYDTIIGERGVGLSGGQRQRIALARALAVKPGILVMDDTTSAVDMETEQYIQGQLRQLPYKCTKIIIAQRISSVRDADQILIVDGGRIVERGKHEELLANKGYYYETWRLQNGMGAEGGES